MPYCEASNASYLAPYTRECESQSIEKNDATILISQSLKAWTNEIFQSRISLELDLTRRDSMVHDEYNMHREQGTGLEEEGPYTTYLAKT